MENPPFGESITMVISLVMSDSIKYLQRLQKNVEKPLFVDVFSKGNHWYSTSM
jgi:hypothetical protein